MNIDINRVWLFTEHRYHRELKYYDDKAKAEKALTEQIIEENKTTK